MLKLKSILAISLLLTSSAFAEPASKSGNVASITINAEEAFHLGKFYLDQKDASKAARIGELFQKSSDQGNGNAENELGLLYLTGKGVAKDVDKAKALFEKAAEKGIDGAIHNMGVLYLSGQGVAKDPKKAMEYFEKAAKKNNKDSQYVLGMLFQKGREPEKVTGDLGDILIARVRALAAEMQKQD